MKVAVPIFRNRIAPHFGTAPALRIHLVQRGRIMAVVELDVAGQSLSDRQKRLVALGTDLLLCGAIEAQALHYLQCRGVRVTADLKGPVAEALKRLLGASAGLGTEQLVREA